MRRLLPRHACAYFSPCYAFHAADDAAATMLTPDARICFDSCRCHFAAAIACFAAIRRCCRRQGIGLRHADAAMMLPIRLPILTMRERCC